MKIILYSITTALVLAVVVVGSTVLLLDTNTFKIHIEKAVEDATGKPLLIEGTPKISIFPPGFTMGAAFWGYKDGQPAQQGISVAIKSSSVSIEIMPLISKKIIVSAVTLIEPAISIINPAETKEEQAENTLHIPEKTEGFTVELQNVHIENATVIMKHSDGVELYINNFNANINDLSPNALSNIAVNTDIRLEQVKAEKKHLLFAGGLKLKSVLMADRDKLSIKQLSVIIRPYESSIMNLSEPLELKVAGTYTVKTGEIELGDIELSSNFVNLSLKSMDNTDSGSYTGDFTLQANLPRIWKILQINADQKNTPQNLTLTGLVACEKNNIYIKNIDGKIDDTSIEAYLDILSFDSMESMNIVGKFNFDSVDLTPYFGLAVRRGSKGLAQTGQTAKQADIVLPKKSPTVNLEFNMGRLILEGIVLKEMQAVITAKAGIYKLSPLKFNLASGGTFVGNIVGDASNNSYRVDITANKINAGDLMQAYRGSSMISALAFFETKLITSGTSINKLKANLAGSGFLKMENIIFTSLSFVPEAIFGNAMVPSKFHVLTVPFVSKHGIIVANPIELLENKPPKTQKYCGLGDALINLPAESLNVNFDATLDSITIPLVITGHFSKLYYGINKEKAARNFFEGKIFRGGAVKAADEVEPIRKSIQNIFDKIIK